MCDFFLGEEPFREGLQLYLDQHQFANAATEDLWAALSEKVLFREMYSVLYVLLFVVASVNFKDIYYF